MRKMLAGGAVAALMVLSAAPAVAAPNPQVIPSVDVVDPAVNGAEHACPGLDRASSNPHQAAQLFRHGCLADPFPPPPGDGGISVS